MTVVNQNKGLSAIPPKVKALLPSDLISQLSQDGHGLSFPEPTGVQMRFIREGKDLGGFYSYNQCGGVVKALRMAMSRCQQLRVKHPPKAHSSKDYVHWIERYDRRKGKVEYSYRVYYNDGTRQLCKSFGFGHNRPSAFKQLHGYRTARLFHFMYELYGAGIVEHMAWFKPWKEIQLYDPDRPLFDWKNR